MKKHLQNIALITVWFIVIAMVIIDVVFIVL